MTSRHARRFPRDHVVLAGRDLVRRADRLAF